MKKFRKVHYLIVVSLLLIVGLVGCEWFDREKADAPTNPAADGLQVTREAVNPILTYQASNIPGITVTADLSARHIAGKPYGSCVLEVSWRCADRANVTQVFVTMTVDEKGQGTALIPPSFLDTVFAESHKQYTAKQDATIWFHTPGLYMNLNCDPSMYK